MAEKSRVTINFFTREELEKSLQKNHNLQFKPSDKTNENAKLLTSVGTQVTTKCDGSCQRKNAPQGLS